MVPGGVTRLHTESSADGGCTGGGCCRVLGQHPRVSPMSPCQPRGPLAPVGRDPLARQGPAGCISAFLFLILLFSYRSTYLRMTVIEAFIKGEAEYRFINSYRASGNIFNPSTTILNKYG